MKKVIHDQVSENETTFRCFHNSPKTLVAFSGFFWLFIILTTFIAGEGLAQVSPGIAPVYLPAGGFHIEGDLKANTPTVNKGDWVTGVTGTGGNVLNDNGSPVNPGSTYHLVDKWDDQTDDKFKGGNKFHDNPNTWEYVNHKAVPKLDINNALIHFTTDTTNGQVWAIIAADRFSENGDAYMDFEFYQDSLYTDNTGNFHSDAPESTGGRTVGDFVLTVHFGNNIDTEFEVYRWENTGGTTYDYVLYTSLPAGSVFASSNSASVPVPYPAFGLNNYVAKTFVEAAVNLSQVLGSMNACVDISITSILIKTKSSHSLTADLDDFLGPLQVTDFSFGNAKAGSAQSKCDDGNYTVFTMAGSAVPSPGFTIVSYTWSVVSYDGIEPDILTPGDLNTDVWVYGTTARVKLTVVTTNGSITCGVDDEVELTVIPEVYSGTVADADEIFCAGTNDPSNITFSTLPTGGTGTFTYQWYYKDGIQDCPTGTSIGDWIEITGATGNYYDPPGGVTASRTYAVLVDATGTPDCSVATWSNGCRKVSVYPEINYGMVASGDETIFITGDPSNISMSTAPSGGAGTFNFQWYYQDGLVTCPSGTNTTGWTLISGATGNSYDPPAVLATSRTYAVMVDPTGTPDCGVPTWAASCRKVTVFNTDPDINATFINVPVPGNVHTNDDVPSGTTYGFPILTSSPGGSIATITMNPDGTYFFTGNQPGIYVYSVPVCPPEPPVPPCPVETLTITAIAPYLYPPVAQTDIATTLQGIPVSLKTMANDVAGNTGGILIPSSVSVLSGTEPDLLTEGSLSVNPLTGDITFTPVLTFTGVVTYTYEVCDNTLPTALCTTAIQQVTVLPAGSPNTTEAADDYNVTPQGVNLFVTAAAGVLVNDNDPEGNSHAVTTLVPITVPGKGSVTFSADGSYVFVPVPVFRGGVSFPYTVCDNGSPVACANATLYIIVTSFNTDPDINATYVDVPVPGDVHTNDDVIENTTYGTPVLASSPAGSSFVITMNSDGTYIFTADKPGIYDFNVPVCAPASLTPPCVDELLTITVITSSTNTNPPVANTDIAFSLGEPVILNTLSNDAAGNPGGTLNPSSVNIVSGTEPDPLTVGSLSVDLLTGDITFNPVPAFAGVATYSYSVCDNSLPTPLCAIALQHVTVLLSGTTEAADDYNSTPQGVPLTIPGSSGVLSNDTDPESDIQTVTSTSQMTEPGKGTVTIAADGSYVFVPVPGYVGPVSFIYTIVDSGIPTTYASATLYIMVTPFNTDPDINATFVNVTVPGNVNTNDDVPVGSTYGTSPVLTSSPSGSNPSITMNADGTYLFTSDLQGIYVYNVPVCEPGVPPPICVNETLTITVTAPLTRTNPPIANTDIATTLQGVPVTLNTLLNDAPGNLGVTLVPSAVTLVTTPDPVTEGSSTIDPVTGKITFMPVSTFTGVVTYTYQVCDNTMPTSLCATALQQITVLPAVRANTTDAADDYNSTSQGVNLIVIASKGVLFNDTDPQGNTQTVTTTSPITVAGKGTVTISGNGSYVFVPFAGFSGPVEFPYSVSDNGTPVAHANATLHILVRPPNPDITPNITAEPNVMHGVTNFNIIIKVTELLSISTSGTITVLVPKDSRWSFTYNPSATFVGSNPVSNSIWSYSSDEVYHIFTTTPAISAGSFSQFGFNAVWNAGFTTGTYTLTSQIISYSGGENRIDNNVDAEKLDYFIY